MAIKNRTELKQYFETGKRPIQSDFGNLIDSVALVSEIPVIPTKPYKVFSALLRIENDSFDISNPHYVARYTLLEENTLGELDISLSRRNEFLIQDLSGEGKLNFERRFIILGTLRDDYNFDMVTESGDFSNDFVQLNFRFRSDGGTLPERTEVPIFYNLPIEIRIYDELIDLGKPIPLPGVTIEPGIPADPDEVLPQNPNFK